MKDYITYSIREYEGVKVIELVGKLASNTIEQFELLLTPLLDKESVMVNMSNMRTVTTSGLNSLIDLSDFAKDKGKRIVILWPNDDLINMTEILEIHDQLIFAESLEEGRTKIKHYT